MVFGVRVSLGGFGNRIHTTHFTRYPGLFIFLKKLKG